MDPRQEFQRQAEVPGLPAPIEPGAIKRMLEPPRRGEPDELKAHYDRMIESLQAAAEEQVQAENLRNENQLKTFEYTSHRHDPDKQEEYRQFRLDLKNAYAALNGHYHNASLAAKSYIEQTQNRGPWRSLKGLEYVRNTAWFAHEGLTSASKVLEKARDVFEPRIDLPEDLEMGLDRASLERISSDGERPSMDDPYRLNRHRRNQSASSTANVVDFDLSAPPFPQHRRQAAPIQEDTDIEAPLQAMVERFDQLEAAAANRPLPTHQSPPRLEDSVSHKLRRTPELTQITQSDLERFAQGTRNTEILRLRKGTSSAYDGVTKSLRDLETEIRRGNERRGEDLDRTNNYVREYNFFLRNGNPRTELDRAEGQWQLSRNQLEQAYEKVSAQYGETIGEINQYMTSKPTSTRLTSGEMKQVSERLTKDSDKLQSQLRSREEERMVRSNETIDSVRASMRLPPLLPGPSQIPSQPNPQLRRNAQPSSSQPDLGAVYGQATPQRRRDPESPDVPRSRAPLSGPSKAGRGRGRGGGGHS
jgi:hypothetical protein